MQSSWLARGLCALCGRTSHLLAKTDVQCTGRSSLQPLRTQRGAWQPWDSGGSGRVQLSACPPSVFRPLPLVCSVTVLGVSKVLGTFGKLVSLSVCLGVPACEVPCARDLGTCVACPKSLNLWLYTSQVTDGKLRPAALSQLLCYRVANSLGLWRRLQFRPSAVR